MGMEIRVGERGRGLHEGGGEGWGGGDKRMNGESKKKRK